MLPCWKRIIQKENRRSKWVYTIYGGSFGVCLGRGGCPHVDEVELHGHA